MTLIIIAILGWVLFLIALFMYWVGAKVNANDTTALEFFCLANLASEEFWQMNHEECLKGFSQMAKADFTHRDALKASCDAILKSGKNAMPENLEIARRVLLTYFPNE